MGRECASRIDAFIRPIAFFDALRKHNVVVSRDGTAFSFGLFCHRMIVDRHVLVVLGLDNHDKRQVCYKKRKKD